MIYLTELLQAPVLDREGRRIGRLAELALAPAEDPRRVSVFVLRPRGVSWGRGRPGRVEAEGLALKQRLSIPYQDVHEVSTGGVRLSTSLQDLAAYSPRDDQLLITKDLLDQQIIDINGRKVVRVNDVAFLEQRNNGVCEVRVSEVDVGVAGALRRLLQGLMPAAFVRKMAGSMTSRAIPWEYVDLIEVNPLRRVKLRIEHHKLARLHPADLADIVEELAPAEREAIFETLDEAKAAEALQEVEPKVQRSIIEGLDSAKAADIVEEMAPDEAADLLAELRQETSEEILDDMQPAEAEEIEELLEFGKDTAGGMMTTEFLAVPETSTVDAAISVLREHREAVPATNTIFTLDERGRLTGAVPLAALLSVPPSTPLERIRPERLLFAHADTAEADVIELFDKYNILTLPVVDREYHVAGVITADDIISLLKAKL